jgi:ABC-type multidrug transport system fused ATPase/permease subunit
MILYASLSAERIRKHHRRVPVMERGRLVQDSTHAELMAAEGLFARMFRS